MSPEKVIDLPDEADDFYIQLRKKIRNYLAKNPNAKKGSEMLLFAPDLFYMLIGLLRDTAVPKKFKKLILIAVTYYIAHIDLMPELLLGPIGFLDDTALAAYIIHELLNHVPESVMDKHWPGEVKLLDALRKILDSADKVLGSTVWKKLQRKVKF